MGCVRLVAVVFLLEVSASLSQANPPFPELPNQFITEVEANILNKNRTVQVTEYYDYPGNQGRLEVFSNGSRHIAIFNYNKQLLYQVRGVDARVCTVRRFNRNSAFGLFTAILPNGTAHIRNVADFFVFGKKYYDSYNGTAAVRGILCDVYTSQLVNDTFNFSMKWYFAARSDWTMPLGGSSPSSAVPVRLDLEGYNQNFNRTTGGQRVPTSGSHYFHHIYEFVNFRIGTADEGDHLFDPPHGIPCRGQPVDKELPRLPSQFTANFQTAVPSKELSYSSLVAYDSQRQSVAYFYNYVTAPHGKSAPYNLTGIHHVIHNFAEGTEYNMTRNGCDVAALNTSKLNDVKIDHGKVFLATPNELFNFESSMNFTYEGEREVDGIATDLWMTTRNDVAVIPQGEKNKPSLWEYHFSKPQWHYGSFGPAVEHQVLVRIEGHSLVPGEFDDVKRTIVVTNFQIGPPWSLFYDDSRCFTSSSARTIQFLLPTDYDVFSLNRSASHQALSASLASAMNVSQGRFHIHLDETAKEQVIVSVRVHDIPKVGDKARLKQLTPLKTAFERLEMAISKGSLTIEDGKKGLVKPVPGSFSYGGHTHDHGDHHDDDHGDHHDDVTPSTHSDHHDDDHGDHHDDVTPSTHGAPCGQVKSSDGYSSGTLAGVAVGMLIVGLVLGGVAGSLIHRKLSFSATAPYKQDVGSTL